VDQIPFGPQLVGETEKALDALLRRELAPTGLTPRHWVTLRLALQRDGVRDGGALGARSPDGGTGLAEHVIARAHLDDATRLVGDLRAAGLLDGDEPTRAGRDVVDAVQGRVRDVVDAVQGRVRAVVGPVLADLPPADAAAAARALDALRAGVRRALVAAAT
jgi:hypothetical protein